MNNPSRTEHNAHHQDSPDSSCIYCTEGQQTLLSGPLHPDELLYSPTEYVRCETPTHPDAGRTLHTETPACTYPHAGGHFRRPITTSRPIATLITTAVLNEIIRDHSQPAAPAAPAAPTYPDACCNPACIAYDMFHPATECVFDATGA
jgi:hypothetical protein